MLLEVGVFGDGVGCFFLCSGGVKSCTWKKVKFGLFSCSRSTADPSSSGAPSVSNITSSSPFGVAVYFEKYKSCLLLLYFFPISKELRASLPSAIHYIFTEGLPGAQ